MKRAINRDQHSPNISVTWARIRGHHTKMVTHVSDRVYYIISGTATFELQGEPRGDVSAGDLVFIPSGTPYVFDGEMDYLVMNGPAFSPGDDVHLE
jgi:mannose-6-phosphate isomerase-like protein (cupin superfamily)